MLGIPVVHVHAACHVHVYCLFMCTGPVHTLVVPVQQVPSQPDLELCLHTAVTVPQALSEVHEAGIAGHVPCVTLGHLAWQQHRHSRGRTSEIEPAAEVTVLELKCVLYTRP